MCETITKKFLGATLQGSKLGLNILNVILLSFNKLELPSYFDKKREKLLVIK